jgi:hypothetical protein
MMTTIPVTIITIFSTIILSMALVMIFNIVFVVNQAPDHDDERCRCEA